MLWQDACALASFIETSGLTHEQFLGVPLARATPLRLLAIVGIHAHALDAATASSCPDVDWECIRSLGGLASDALPYQAAVVTLEKSWDAATRTVPAMRRAIANDIRVVRARTRWAHLIHREPDDWPLPDATLPVDGSSGREVCDALTQVMGEFDAVRTWIVDAGDPAVVSVERGERLEPADVATMRARLAEVLGRDVTVLIQDQIYPLVWDEVIAKERLAWESDATVMPTPAGPALPHAHRHVEVHGSARPQGDPS